VDSGVGAGSVVSEFYDPLIAKLIVHGRDRATTIPSMERALREYRIDGVPTTIPFHRVMLQTPEFIKGDLWTTMIEDLGISGRLRGPRVPPDHIAALALALASRPHVIERFAERQRLHRPHVSQWTARGREDLKGGTDAVSARRQR